jgi:hypothetical protein
VIQLLHQRQQQPDLAGREALAGELGLIPAEIAEQARTLYRTLRQPQPRMWLNNLTPCRMAQGEIDTGASQQLWKTLFAAD